MPQGVTSTLQAVSLAEEEEQWVGQAARVLDTTHRRAARVKPA